MDTDDGPDEDPQSRNASENSSATHEQKKECSEFKLTSKLSTLLLRTRDDVANCGDFGSVTGFGPSYERSGLLPFGA